ncbi:MAG: CRISPR-associated helicase Cas3', partial [Candidatus Heimdallarchaeota archaeon]|nr:CRISPR-associated helicase Cas3' [Candidatus Heimdallarchaeota archaeon]
KSYIDNSKKHHIAFEPDRINLPNSLIDNFRIKKFNHTSDVNSNVSTSMQLINQIRNQLYSSSNLKISDLQSYKDSIFLMDAPTGSAKTLALLNVGIKLKNRILLEEKQQPRIIYALPFVSIIDQVGAVIQDILVSSQLLNAEEFGQNQLLTLHHHLADSKWIYLETDGLENSIINEGETKNTYTMHRVNTWHSEIIVTSFIKLFNTICKSHKRELIRFHRLAGSIILIDEVQGIPAQYWELIMQVFETLTKSLNCYIVLASATLPKVLLPASLNQVNLFDDKEINYPSLNRYNLFLDCYDIDIQDFITISINDFYKHLLTKFGNVLDNQYLIVVNTTRVAYSLYDSLHKKYDEGVFLLSTQILPIHRAVIISEISQRLKDNKPTILISTQLIEAGVDFSFKIVYRDFCPLDSIIQVAGRCNRNFEFDEPQEIRLVMLTENNGKIFYNLIYNQHLVNLNITTTLLKSINKQVISENELRNLSNNYFNSIAQIRVTNTLLEEYQQGRFETMNNNFSLIDNTYNQIPIVLMLDENKKFTKEYFHKKLKHIPNKLRPYTIEVSKSNLDTIISQIPETSFKCVKGKYDSTDIYFIQLTGENAKDIYTKQTGLKMVSFI